LANLVFQLVFSLFFLLWNALVVLVLISVARTHTIDLREDAIQKTAAEMQEYIFYPWMNWKFLQIKIPRATEQFLFFIFLETFCDIYNYYFAYIGQLTDIILDAT
jgi:hypothetical protein